MFKTLHGEISYTKIMLVFGWGVVMFYTVRYLERIIGLPDNLFTQALPYVTGLMVAITGLLSATYGWSKKIDHKVVKDE